MKYDLIVTNIEPRKVSFLIQILKLKVEMSYKYQRKCHNLIIYIHNNKHLNK